MAIQNRRGVYSDFTPSKMVPGELAVVQSGDPNNSSGKAVYAAFGASGDVKRLATEDDLGSIDTELSDKVDKVSGKGLSTNDYTNTEKTKLAGIASGAEVNVQSDWNQSNTSADDFIKNKPTKTSDFTNDGDGTSNFATESYVQQNGGKIDTISVNGTQQTITNKNVDIPVPVIDNTLTQTGKAADAKIVGDELADVKSDLDNLTDAFNVKKYGVSGVGQSANQLTRILDAVGMVAEVGTDGNNSAVRNDFDSAAPWKWRKCVGHWTKGEDRGIFHVHAYKGDADYTEDGTNGDYVAVECPISYYKMDGDRLIVSAHQHEGFRPFDIFCHNHNPQDTIPYYYRPAYALALKDGKAVSLPGLDNCQGAYKTIMDDARTYDGGALGGLAITYPMALSFYDWAMFTVEFAAQNCQSIMQGCAGLRHNADDRLTFKDATHVLVSNWQVSRVVGEYIAIVPTNVDINAWTVSATHKIIGVTRCNADGTASTSGAYTLLEITDLGKAYYEYDITGGTEYRICGRPYRTGECNSVSTPSGSPVSNSDSYHPMKYRWVENLYSNQYKTVADFFNKRVGTDDSDYYLEHYYLLRPQDYDPSTTSKPDTTDLATDKFEKILETPHVNYVNGYVKSKKYSDEYPDIWIPGETTGASTSTYFADYASLVHSYAVRSVRSAGSWHYGAYAGLSYFNGTNAPSHANAHYGGGLCVIQ